MNDTEDVNMTLLLSEGDIEQTTRVPESVENVSEDSNNDLWLSTLSPSVRDNSRREVSADAFDYVIVVLAVAGVAINVSSLVLLVRKRSCSMFHQLLKVNKNS